MKPWRSAVMLLAGFAVLNVHAAPAPVAPLPRDSIYQFDASLMDQEGRAAPFRALRGQPRLVTMFYTSCQYVCPMIVDSLKAIERALTPAERGRIGFVLVTMDPERDSPAVLKAVMQQRRLDATRWTLLQPAKEDLRGIAGVLGIRYRALDDGEFNHTTTLVLLDADGRVLARSDRIGGKPEPEFLAAVRNASAR